ncbi:MAG: hypothetical protein WCD86_10400 [Ktedonobacteraceae bacterium]
MRVSSDQQPIGVFCLHALLLSLIVFLLMLASCSSAAQPAGYVWTDQDTLASLSWNNQNGQLSGVWTSVSYATTPFPASTSPAVTTVEYSGTVTASGIVTLTLKEGAFYETITGTVSSNEQTLHLTQSDLSTGQHVQHTWVAVPAEQEPMLLAAFNAYEVVRGMLSAVQQDTAHEQAWSDPNAGDVAQARQAVMAQAEELTAIQQARDETARCQDIAQFAPLPASTFMLLFAPSQNGLVRDFTTLTHAWDTAQHTSASQIASLNLSWLLSMQTYQRQSQGASRLVARINLANQQDEQAMQQLEQQDQAMTQQVARLGKRCPPTPA